MGRERRLLREETILIKLPSEKRRKHHSVTHFWAHGRNTSDLASLKASHQSQCYFDKLCQRHTALIAPKSLLHNFTKLQSTSLDCKPCQVYNSARNAVTPSQYEITAYHAVSCLPPEYGVAEEDMLVDHRLLGMSGSSVDIYVPRFRLCIMIDGEAHFRDSRDTLAEDQGSIDDRFNRDAVQKGYRVLRLHHEDAALYKVIIRIAVQRCLSGVYGSLDFSKAYGNAVREQWGLPPLK